MSHPLFRTALIALLLAPAADAQLDRIRGAADEAQEQTREAGQDAREAAEGAGENAGRQARDAKAQRPDQRAGQRAEGRDAKAMKPGQRLAHEEGKHRDRMARIQRLRQIAEEQGQTDRLDVIAKLERKETDRYERRRKKMRAELGDEAFEASDRKLGKGRKRGKAFEKWSRKNPERAKGAKKAAKAERKAEKKAEQERKKQEKRDKKAARKKDRDGEAPRDDGERDDGERDDDGDSPRDRDGDR